MSESNWKLWEVFLRSKNGLSHKHVGSLHAADADMAIKNARDVYTRRSEGISIWVVPSEEITAALLTKKILYLPLQMIRCIVILPFMTSPMMLNTCR